MYSGLLKLTRAPHSPPVGLGSPEICWLVLVGAAKPIHGYQWDMLEVSIVQPAVVIPVVVYHCEKREEKSVSLGMNALMGGLKRSPNRQALYSFPTKMYWPPKNKNC